MTFRCDQCGKFTKDENLISHYTPDSHFSTEDLWYSCTICEPKCVCGQYQSECVDCPYGSDSNGNYV